MNRFGKESMYLSWVTLVTIFLTAGRVSADTLTVNVNTDAVNATDGTCSFHEAVVASNTDTASGAVAGECDAGSGDDVIVFDLAFPDTIRYNAFGVTFTEGAHVIGPGSDRLAIAGAGFDRIMVFSTDLLPQQYKVSGLTVMNGIGDIAYQTRYTGGGNVLVHASEVDFVDVIFRAGQFNGATLNGLAEAAGGGLMIYSDTSIVRIDSCTFADNRVFGSAPSGGGGAIATLGGDLYISNSTFHGNEADILGNTPAEEGMGGALWIGGIVDTVSVINSTFTQNESRGPGGAIMIGSIAVTSEVTATYFDHITVYDNLGDSDNDGAHGAGFTTSTIGTTIGNSVIIGNHDGSGADFDVSVGNTTSNGYNYIGVEEATDFPAGTPNANGDWAGTSGAPLVASLLVLSDNGGPTETVMPMSSSPLVDLIPAGSCSRTTDQRGAIRPRGGNSTQGDGNGCDVGAVERYCAGSACNSVLYRLELQSRLFLEGAYVADDSMATPAGFASNVPTSQPYGAPTFSGTPLAYTGGEFVSSFPSSAIDWLKVSLRTGTAASSKVPNSDKAVLLLENGSVVDTSGAVVNWPNLPTGMYRPVFHHRNHLAVMSDSLVDFTSGTGTHSFTNTGSAYTDGGAALKHLGSDDYGLIGANTDADGSIDISDFAGWLVDAKAAASGYLSSDFDLSGDVAIGDFAIWLVNAKVALESQVPE